MICQGSLHQMSKLVRLDLGLGLRTLALVIGRNIQVAYALQDLAYRPGFETQDIPHAG
jgi:hypothetical protein